MKYSQYNIFIQLKNHKVLLYNTLSDKFIILSENNYFLIQKNNIDALQQFAHDLYDKLISINSIINAEINEFDYLIRQFNLKLKDDSLYHLIINPTTNCNFKCWYCYETHNKTSKMSDLIVNNTKLHIENTILNQTGLKTFILSFFGGEPLLYFKSIVVPLMEYTQQLCIKHNKSIVFGFTTNGYLVTKQMAEWFGKFKNITFQITLDGDKEKHDKVRFPAEGLGSYDKIISNIKMLLSYGSNVVLRVNYTTENINSLNNISANFDNLNEVSKLKISFHRIWQDYKNENVDNSVFEVISNISKSGLCASEYTCDSIRYPCYADMKYGALINYNGNVYRCTARDFETTKRDGYLTDEGEIVWENDSDINRINLRFKNELCRKCTILPLCGGGCSQKAIESCECNKYYCLHPTDEEKNKIILDRFYNHYVAKNIEK